MSMTGAALSLAHELAAIAGREHVTEDPAELAQFAFDGLQPGVAVSPGSAEEVAAVLRLASQRNSVVVPAGGCTQLGFGAVPERVDLLLRTSRLDSIAHFDPGDLTMGADSGVTMAALQRALAPHQLFLPLDVARREQATVGGVLATAAHGPLKHGYGGVRDFCIGMKFVTAEGKIAKAGGRVVKNVAGYDLMKLMIGGLGTLGVMVSANFKLFPQPRQTRTFIAEFSSLEQMLRLRDRVLQSPLAPLCLETISPAAEEFVSILRSQAGSGPGGCWRIALRAGGSEAVLQRYGRELGDAVVRQLDGDSEAQLWRLLSEFPETVRARAAHAMLVQVNVPLSECGAALQAAERAAQDNGLVCAAIGRVGVGSLLVACIPLLEDPPAAGQYGNAISALRAALSREASAVVLRCPWEAKRHFSVWGSSPTDLGAMRAVKQALDPLAILNRGRFVV